MIKRISFKSSGFAGDLIHYLAAIRQVCRDQDAHAEIYLWLDRDGKPYEGAYHPYGGKMLNQYTFDMLYPLLIEQPYIAHVAPWKGEEIMVDIDKIREAQVDMPYGNLAHWVGLRYPDMQTDLSERWLHTSIASRRGDLVDQIIINRTSRYLNPYVSYYFLSDYQDRLIFAGLENEYWDFRKQWGLDKLQLLKVKDFHELAHAISYCKFFIGNQSMCFALAEGLKVPRLLEMCPYAPNVHPVGRHAHYFKFQEGLTYWVNRLDKQQL